MPWLCSLSVQAVFAAVRDHIRQQLGIVQGVDTVRKVAESKYAHDYYITSDTIRNLRTAHVDQLWKRHPVDIHSVWLAVRMRLMLWPQSGC